MCIDRNTSDWDSWASFKTIVDDAQLEWCQVVKRDTNPNSEPAFGARFGLSTCEPPLQCLRPCQQRKQLF